MLRKTPFILMEVILAVIVLESMIPLSVKQAMFSVSLSIKSIIIFFLPLVIFSLLFKAVVTLSTGASKIIAIILLSICVSNFISTFLSHYVGIWIYSFDLSIITPQPASELKPLWTLTLPVLIANDKAMFASIVVSLILSRFNRPLAQKIALQMEKYVSILLNFFTYIIPVFVIGFVVKMQYDGVAGIIAKDYTNIFVIVALSQFTYILLSYFLLNKCRVKDFAIAIRNMLPAAISGFSTMSSAASMPLTILAVEANSENKDIARSVVPASVNIHLVGDCFAIPIFAYAVLKSFGIAEPTLLSYLIFTCYFVLAKFSVAAIPGGGIIVMLPILEQNLGFNVDMMALITGLYILFDPVITCANVLGNGAFAKLIDRFYGRTAK